MTFSRKVMWLEGMFLRPNHFQQQDLRAETLLAARISSIAPFFWGFTELKLDVAALAAGKIGLSECSGAFKDGTAFSLGGDISTIKSIAVKKDVSNSLVWLCTPEFSPNGRLASERSRPDEVLATKYSIEVMELGNHVDGSAGKEALKVGSPNVFLKIGNHPGAGYDCLPIALISEVSTNRGVVLDPEFVPPILSVNLSKSLFDQFSVLTSTFLARSDRLAGRFGVAGGASVSAQNQFMLLNVCNRWLGRFRQMIGSKVFHPLTLHAELCTAAAELATFANQETRLPEEFPDYDHDDLTGTFKPVFESLSNSLGYIEDDKAIPIDLEYHAKQRIFYNRKLDSTWLDDSRFILVVKASMADDELRTTFPRRASVSSTNEIMETIRAAERSIPLRALPHFPPEIRPLSGWVCFELDKNAAGWANVKDHKSVAIHPQSVFEDLDMSLWVIKD